MPVPIAEVEALAAGKAKMGSVMVPPAASTAVSVASRSSTWITGSGAAVFCVVSA